MTLQLWFWPVLGESSAVAEVRIGAVECRVLFLDNIAERGCDLFRVAFEGDLEGIVEK